MKPTKGRSYNGILLARKRSIEKFKKEGSESDMCIPAPFRKSGISPISKE